MFNYYSTCGAENRPFFLKNLLDRFLNSRECAHLNVGLQMGIGINRSLCKSNRFIQIKFKEIAVSNFPFQGCGDWQFICFAGTEVARSSLWLFTQSGGKSEENSWTDKHNRPLIVIFLKDSCAQNRTTWSRVLMRSWRGWYLALNQKQLNNKKRLLLIVYHQ